MAPRGPMPVSVELPQQAILGVDAETPVTEEAIATALAARGKRVVRPGSRVLLLQSAATYPDAPLLDAVRTAGFAVDGYDGRAPTNLDPTGKGYAKVLRLAAAQGGYDTIVCVWGVLESQRYDKGTKLISWVPVVNRILPDETENMRIKLRAAVVDVATGRWTLLTPTAEPAKLASRFGTRERDDQRLVEQLKASGYAALGKDLQDLAQHPAAAVASD